LNAGCCAGTFVAQRIVAVKSKAAKEARRYTDGLDGMS
jgi:hypothetical protein